MGDLLSKEMLADLAINIINILILFFVSKALLYKPVKKMLDKRKEKSAALLNDAAVAAEKAEKSRQDYEKLSAGIDCEKKSILESTREDAERDARAIVDEAKKQAAQIVSDAKAKAVHEREKAIADAKNDIVDAAIGISERILSREVSEDDNRNLIESFFSGQESL